MIFPIKPQLKKFAILNWMDGRFLREKSAIVYILVVNKTPNFYGVLEKEIDTLELLPHFRDSVKAKKNWFPLAAEFVLSPNTISRIFDRGKY